ncbi:5'-flap endonuclease [Coniochaeta pulveracea]|uniref:Structure-specific endonuclease subunit SLX4 n=1 Tax=Coniochaeta pulveracea TaxID=177199 RepID=A0A420YKB9_9PEZI|nr:5'-flap endonuclease [Coniochaeta pulveracea]
MGSESHAVSCADNFTHDNSVIAVSSSPELPAIDDIVSRAVNQPVRWEPGRNTSIPQTASKTFLTASDLWRANQAELQNEHSPNICDSATQGLEHGRKCAVLSTTIEPVAPVATSGEIPSVGASPEVIVQQITTKRARKPRVKKTDTTIAPVEKEAPVKHQRARKTKAQDAKDGQTTLPKGKVTKVVAVKAKPSMKRAETVSKHFVRSGSAVTHPDAAVEALDPIVDPIDLEPALARRIDWTPTKDTVPLILSLDSPVPKGSGPLESTEPISSLQSTRDLFANLHDIYGCAGHAEKRRTSPAPAEAVDILGKRKLVEMVTTSGSSFSVANAPKPKAKAAKKKPRTITGLATAAYRVQDPSSEDQEKDDSLLHYFDMEQDTNAEVKTATTTTTTSKTTKGGAKPKPKKATKKRAEVPKPVLLSPATALRQVSRQDFVFGTSSQLATEEDAGLLRDIQQAMKASNQQDDDELDKLFASSPVNNALARNPSRKLWAAGARDADGDLLQVEVIDLVDDPAIPKDLTNPDVILTLVEPQNVQQPLSEWQKVVASEAVAQPDAISLPSSPTSEPRVEPQLHFRSRQKEISASSVTATVNSISAVTPRMAASSVLLTDLSDWDDEPPASNQEQFLTSQAGKSPKKSMNRATCEKTTHSTPDSPIARSLPAEARPPAVSKPMPKFEACSDVQLAEEVRKYGFKPIKRRAAAIALLTECWLSKNRALGTTAALSTSSKPSGKATTATIAPKARGRLKKDNVSAIEGSVSSPARAEPAKKPRGRPKKDTSTAVTTKTASKKVARATAEPVPRPSTPKGRKKSLPARDVVEIADSEDEAMAGFLSSPSPSLSLSPEPINEFSSPSPADVSMTEDDSLTATPTDDQAALFKRITDAVTSAPRSKDPANPSWHEKMLMYDPVVLEDLTAWLNGGQLDRVGWDGEASTADVKKCL